MSLSYRLLAIGREDDKSDRLTKISFDDADTLRVSLLEQGQVVKEGVLSRKRGDFTCSDEGLMVRDLSKSEARDGALSYSSHSIALSTADGGVLAGKVQNSGVGVVFIIPIIGTQTIWYKWDVAPTRQ